MYLGIDFGTSGARACVIDVHKSVTWEGRVTYADATVQTPQDWHDALYTLLEMLPQKIAPNLRGIAIDGTSGTVLLCDETLTPIGPALMYDDARAVEQAHYLATLAPTGNSVSSPSSGLAKLLWLMHHHPGARCMLHQADWLTALLSGQTGISDYHNALKTGYDVAQLCWPDWIQALPCAGLLPRVIEPGMRIGPIQPELAMRYGIAIDCQIHAGTTDSIAAFIATGVSEPGIGVTALGTTLVLKQLSLVRIEAPEFGIYSHRYGKLWLAEGASNAGAGVLRRYFDDAQLAAFSANIDATHDSTLDYYPLPKMGERFPTNDPALLPRLAPRPADDTLFLHGILQGLARIEATGYARLTELGAGAVSKVVSNGGGAYNTVWRAIRSRYLNCPITISQHNEASYGAAILATGTMT